MLSQRLVRSRQGVAEVDGGFVALGVALVLFRIVSLAEATVRALDLRPSRAGAQLEVGEVLFFRQAENVAAEILQKGQVS